MGFLVDGNGAPWPVGQHVVRWESRFEEGSIPAWLTGSTAGNNAGATYVVYPGADAGNIPHLLMTTAATLNSRATLLGPLIDSSMVRRMRVDVVTLGGAVSNSAGDGKSLTFGFHSAPNGTSFPNGAVISEAQNEASGMPWTIMRDSVAAAFSGQRTGRQWRGSADTIHHHGLIIDYAQRSVFLMNHDQLVSGGSVADAMPTGSMYPYLRMLATEAVAVSLRVLRFNVTVEY